MSCHLDSVVRLHMVYVYSLQYGVWAVIIEGGSRLLHSSQSAARLENVIALLLSIVLMLRFLQCTLSFLLFAAAFVGQIF